MVSAKWVKTWSTAAGLAPLGRRRGAPSAVGRQARASRRAALWRAGAPAGRGRHARASRRRPAGAASAALARLERIAPRLALPPRRAEVGERAAAAVGSARRADGRAEVHHRLGEVAGLPSRA